MENFNQDYQKYQEAKKRVHALKEFYSHLASFIIFNALIVFINLKYTPEHLWFYWSTLGWGIGLFFHAMKVFRLVPFFSKEWEEKKISQFMEEEKQQNTKFE